MSDLHLSTQIFPPSPSRYTPMNRGVEFSSCHTLPLIWNKNASLNRTSSAEHPLCEVSLNLSTSSLDVSSFVDWKTFKQKFDELKNTSGLIKCNESEMPADLGKLKLMEMIRENVNRLYSDIVNISDSSMVQESCMEELNRKYENIVSNIPSYSALSPELAIEIENRLVLIASALLSLRKNLLNDPKKDVNSLSELRLWLFEINKLLKRINRINPSNTSISDISRILDCHKNLLTDIETRGHVLLGSVKRRLRLSSDSDVCNDEGPEQNKINKRLRLFDSLKRRWERLRYDALECMLKLELYLENQSLASNASCQSLFKEEPPVKKAKLGETFKVDLGMTYEEDPCINTLENLSESFCSVGGHSPIKKSDSDFNRRYNKFMHKIAASESDLLVSYKEKSNSCRLPRTKSAEFSSSGCSTDSTVVDYYKTVPNEDYVDFRSLRDLRYSLDRSSFKDGGHREHRLCLSYDFWNSDLFHEPPIMTDSLVVNLSKSTEDLSVDHLQQIVALMDESLEMRLDLDDHAINYSFPTNSSDSDMGVLLPNDETPCTNWTPLKIRSAAPSPCNQKSKTDSEPLNSEMFIEVSELSFSKKSASKRRWTREKMTNNLPVKVLTRNFDSNSSDLLNDNSFVLCPMKFSLDQLHRDSFAENQYCCDSNFKTQCMPNATNCFNFNVTGVKEISSVQQVECTNDFKTSQSELSKFKAICEQSGSFVYSTTLAPQKDEIESVTPRTTDSPFSSESVYYEWDDYKPPKHDENGSLDNKLDDSDLTAFGDDYLTWLESLPSSARNDDDLTQDETLKKFLSALNHKKIDQTESVEKTASPSNHKPDIFDLSIQYDSVKPLLECILRQFRTSVAVFDIQLSKFATSPSNSHQGIDCSSIVDTLASITELGSLHDNITHRQSELKEIIRLVGKCFELTELEISFQKVLDHCNERLKLKRELYAILINWKDADSGFRDATCRLKEKLADCGSIDSLLDGCSYYSDSSCSSPDSNNAEEVRHDIKNCEERLASLENLCQRLASTQNDQMDLYLECKAVIDVHKQQMVSLVGKNYYSDRIYYEIDSRQLASDNQTFYRLTSSKRLLEDQLADSVVSDDSVEISKREFESKRNKRKRPEQSEDISRATAWGLSKRFKKMLFYTLPLPICLVTVYLLLLCYVPQETCGHDALGNYLGLKLDYVAGPPPI